jgi:hypothetical protein
MHHWPSLATYGISCIDDIPSKKLSKETPERLAVAATIPNWANHPRNKP